MIMKAITLHRRTAWSGHRGMPSLLAARSWLRAWAPARPAARQRQPRPVVVPDSLDDLQGPGSGVLELPITLFWSRPDRTFNLADRYQAIDLYLAVLDRGSVDELATYLNGRLLVELWPDLRLTRAKRLPWQARFAELRPAAVAA